MGVGLGLGWGRIHLGTEVGLGWGRIGLFGASFELNRAGLAPLEPVLS